MSKILCMQEKAVLIYVQIGFMMPADRELLAQLQLYSTRQTLFFLSILICMQIQILSFHNETHEDLTLMLPLSFKTCQKFCGEFTAESTHCSFPSSTVKEHLIE